MLNILIRNIDLAFQFRAVVLEDFRDEEGILMDKEQEEIGIAIGMFFNFDGKERRVSWFFEPEPEEDFLHLREREGFLKE